VDPPSGCEACELTEIRSTGESLAHREEAATDLASGDGAHRPLIGRSTDLHRSKV
jgi:hypothetical protein